jgi:hypothetical protein
MREEFKTFSLFPRNSSAFTSSCRCPARRFRFLDLSGSGFGHKHLLRFRNSPGLDIELWKIL